MSNIFLETIGLSYRFLGQRDWVLSDINMRIPKASLTLLVGPSGSGKSTLLKVLRGMHGELGGEQRGQIVINREDITELPSSELGSKVAIVFQNPSYQLHLPRVVDEIISAPMYQGLPWGECVSRAEMACTGIIDPALLQRDPNDLSLGEQQKVALAASLAMQAQIVLLDEPFSYLDTQGTKTLIEVIHSLYAEKSMTVIVVTHDIEPLASLADCVLVMQQGRCVMEGHPRDVFYSDLYANVVGAPLYISVSRSLNREHGTSDQPMSWSELLTGHGCGVGLQCNDPSCSTDVIPEAIPVIEFNNVSYNYSNGHPGVTDVSFSVNASEILGIVGNNGSGKTTIARLMVNLIRPAKGHIKFKGVTLLPRMNLSDRVGYVTQNPLDMLFENTIKQECAFGPWALGHPMSDTQISETLDSVGLTSQIDRDPRSLSGGEQRLLTVADALANTPDVLILDEPEFGLDVQCFERLKDIIKQFQKNGKTVVVITHSLLSAAILCNRILLIKGGAVLGIDNTDAIMSDTNLFEKADLIYPPALSLIAHAKQNITNELSTVGLIEAIANALSVEEADND